MADEVVANMPRKVFSWVEVNYKVIIDNHWGADSSPGYKNSQSMNSGKLLPFIQKGMTKLENNAVYLVNEPIFIYREHFNGAWSSLPKLKVFVAEAKPSGSGSNVTYTPVFDNGTVCELYNTECAGNNHGEVMFPLSPGHNPVYMFIEQENMDDGQSVYAISAYAKEAITAISKTSDTKYSSTKLIARGLGALTRLSEIFKAPKSNDLIQYVKPVLPNNTFLEKQLVGPKINPPGHDINIKLNAVAGNNYPVVKDGAKSIMPDVPRAISMETSRGSGSSATKVGNISRVNVPGYFYKWSKLNSDQSDYGSALVLGERPEDIDVWGCKLKHFVNVDNINKDSESKRASVTLEDSECEYVFMGISSAYRKKLAGKQDDYNDFCRESAASMFCPIVKSTGQQLLYPGEPIIKSGVQNSAVFYAITIQQPKKADPDRNNNKITYFVCTGNNSYGGHMNNMIPIIPGVDGYCEVCEVLHGDCTEELAFRNMTIKVGAKKSDKDMGFNSARGAPGTFVFFHNTDRAKVTHYFIPTKSNPGEDTIKSLTTIRTSMSEVTENKLTNWDGLSITVLVQKKASAETKCAQITLPDDRHTGLDIAKYNPKQRTSGADTSAKLNSGPGSGFMNVFNNQSKCIDSNGNIIGHTMAFAVVRYKESETKGINDPYWSTSGNKVVFDDGADILDYLQGGADTFAIYFPISDS